MTYYKNKTTSLLLIIFIILSYCPLTIAVEINEHSIPAPIMLKIQNVADEYFKVDINDIQMHMLTGGFAATSIRLDLTSASYVLRVLNDGESLYRVNAELFAMQHAAEAEIAPKIYWYNANGYDVLMDYIPGSTLKIENGKKPEVIADFATLARKVHDLPKNPFNALSFKEHMEEFYLIFASQSKHPEQWERAINIIRQGDLELKKSNSYSVNTHGDLNPRNILMTNQRLFFIDWSDTMFTDPFHDLTYYSIMMDYTSSEEELLLKKYLQHAPSVNEIKRFLIAKKMNFARLAMVGLFIGNKLRANAQIEDDFSYEVRDWSYYAHTFAKNDTPLSAEFFFELAQAAFISANAIDLKLQSL